MVDAMLKARGSITQDDLTSGEKQALMVEEEQAKITSYEEAFRRIKEATGVSDTSVSILCIIYTRWQHDNLYNLGGSFVIVIYTVGGSMTTVKYSRWQHESN